MKKVSLFLMGSLLTTAAAFAGEPDAPAYLEKQSADSCLIKKVIVHFQEEQKMKDIQPVTFNYNGEKEVGSIQASGRFDDQTIQSKDKGYNVRIRRFGSDLAGGDALDFVFDKMSCTPTKIFMTCGNTLYSEIKLVKGKCPEEAKGAWKKGQKQAATLCPIAEEMCKVLGEK